MARHSAFKRSPSRVPQKPAPGVNILRWLFLIIFLSGAAGVGAKTPPSPQVPTDAGVNAAPSAETGPHGEPVIYGFKWETVTFCGVSNMAPVADSKETGPVCEPKGDTVLKLIAACLSARMEAVIISDLQGVLCTKPQMGAKLLARGGAWRLGEPYLEPRQIDIEDVCERGPQDKRKLDPYIVRELIKQYKDTIDFHGIRIIGGIFCDGLDIEGLDIPYSLILDQSLVKWRVGIRNFRTKGDLSLDNSVIYGEVDVLRSDISGTLWMTNSFAKLLIIDDTIIKGSVKLNNTFILLRVSLENDTVEGDVDLSAMFFSQLEVLKDKIHGVLDISQSQARCSFDIRKNEIADIVATRLGFGEARLTEKGEVVEPFRFRSVSTNPSFGRSLKNKLPDPLTRFAGEDPTTNTTIKTGNSILSATDCPRDRGIKPGTFVLIDNRIKSSLCIKDFNWLTDANGKPLESEIYFNEDNIEGETWLDIARQPGIYWKEGFIGSPTQSRNRLHIFNLKTGTLVLNFDFTQEPVTLAVNGLQFSHIYGSRADCESSVSPRARNAAKFVAGDGRGAQFPPKLELPKTRQVISWINKNSFRSTQQPFAEFVRAFEREGNTEGAKELKITAADGELQTELCNLAPSIFSLKDKLCGAHDRIESEAGLTIDNPPEAPALAQDQKQPDRIDQQGWFETIKALFEEINKAVVAILSLILWLLADHGYKPEWIGWWVIITLLTYYFILFPRTLRIIGYSVDSAPNTPRHLKLIFFFDRMLPAYRLREENYKIVHFYKRLNDRDSNATKTMKFLNKDVKIRETTEEETARVEKYLDLLKLSGLIFTIFIIAAVSKLAH